MWTKMAGLARAMRMALAGALLAAGCDGAAPVEDAATSTEAATDVATDTTAARDGERTIETCPTAVSSEAPAFFAQYFRCVDVTTNDTDVVIETQGLPPHRSNYYATNSPNYEPFDTSRGARYRANPNRLSAQDVVLSIPKSPVSRGLTITTEMVDGVVGTNANEYPMGVAGVAIDSVLLFNPMARPGDDIEAEQYTFDRYNAHPAPSGDYHYHTVSRGPLELLESIGLGTGAEPGSASLELFGLMCDGTVVLGCTELDGTAAPIGTLDAQGGHVHDLTERGGAVAFADRYHVHLCPSVEGGRRFTPEIQYYDRCTR